MKIAFVGKWGSGKTTLAASFIEFLQSKHLFTIAIDADINVWLASALGLDFDISRRISDYEKSRRIRSHLLGNNTRIGSVDHFVKTTPPWSGSNLLHCGSDSFFEEFCSHTSKNLKFFHVGTYEHEEVGISCYHTHLSVFENILSHTFLQNGEYVIADMVAWNDAFSNTLFLQFDILSLVVEPTAESVAMTKSYIKLMKMTGSSTKIVILANKIEDSDDLAYLKEHEISPDFVFEYDTTIKKARQKNRVPENIKNHPIWASFLNMTQSVKLHPSKKLLELGDLHRKYIKLDYIATPLGDLSHQIDTSFQFLWA